MTATNVFKFLWFQLLSPLNGPMPATMYGSMDAICGACLGFCVLLPEFECYSNCNLSQIFVVSALVPP